MAEAMKFDESVMLVDVAFLNHVIEDLRRNFSRMLMRDLKRIDLSELISFIALDAGLKPDAENKIQVLLIYDDLSAKIVYSDPGDVEKELNNVAFQSDLGEFSFYSFCPEGLVSIAELLTESAKIAFSEKEVQRLWIVADDTQNESLWKDILPQEETDKEILVFSMSDPVGKKYRQELLGYPVMQALGIRSDEVN